ncbi:MAG: GIY-YIG nuclease family protein [Candidatus Blackburnbacteria bacterium]|nr:GIY-YIG nuclease family protein [Candidatus Blackburnbacteria bacterium]
MPRQMYVYIMANTRPTLYTGVTNGLVKRVWQHKNNIIKGFTSKYNLHNLVYYEVIEGEIQAIVREKQIKDMNRGENLAMIRHFNPTLKDLYSEIVR